MRRGDWKLIRLFAQNEDGSDQFELYNLRDDLSETKNLVDGNRILVREMNVLIDGFLKDTEAVIPKVNPAYRAPPITAAKIDAPDAWTASKDTTLTVADNELRIESAGRDPWISTKAISAVTGPFTLEISMKSTAPGAGQVFFTVHEKDGFGRAKIVPFTPKADAAFHTYGVALDVPGRIFALRIDPATGPGSIVIRSLVLRDAGGAAVKTWSFHPAPVPAPRSGAASRDRPNILLLLIEDQGAHLGCLGTPGLKTPHMDALAKDGVLFRQYYVGRAIASKY